MIVVRATAKLLKKLRSDTEENPPNSTGILGDWYCNIAIIQKQHLIICVSQKTLLPIILPAKDPASFPKRLRTGRGSYKNRCLQKRHRCGTCGNGRFRYIENSKQADPGVNE